MNKNAELKLPAPLLRTVRPPRLDALFGRDWRIAWPFVLPIVIIMAGLFSGVHQRDPARLTTRI